VVEVRDVLYSTAEVRGALYLTGQVRNDDTIHLAEVKVDIKRVVHHLEVVL